MPMTLEKASSPSSDGGALVANALITAAMIAYEPSIRPGN